MAGDSVSLENYVQQVCEQVLKGVLKAQSTEEIGKYVGIRPLGDKNYDNNDNFVTKISFEVFAEINSNATGTGKVGISVAGAKGELSKGQSASNRISFEVPVAIPQPIEEVEASKRRRAEQDRALGY